MIDLFSCSLYFFYFNFFFETVSRILIISLKEYGFPKTLTTPWNELFDNLKIILLRSLI